MMNEIHQQPVTPGEIIYDEITSIHATMFKSDKYDQHGLECYSYGLYREFNS